MLRTYRFFDDVKALLVYLKGGHLLNYLLQQDVLFVIVTFNRQLQQTAREKHYPQAGHQGPSHRGRYKIVPKILNRLKKMGRNMFTKH